MLKKEQKAQLSGLHQEENKVTPARKLLMRLSEIHICSLYHLTKVAFLVMLLLIIEYCYAIAYFFTDILTISDIFLFFSIVDPPGKFNVSFVTAPSLYKISPEFQEIVTTGGSECLLNLFLYFTLQVEEVYNFSQDDLLPEDILILDTHAEVFIWIGHSVEPKEKRNAFEIGQVNMLNNLWLLSPILPST